MESTQNIRATDLCFKGGNVLIALAPGWKEEVLYGWVCSQAMALASPQWKNQLQPTGDKDPTSKLSFKEDAFPLLLVLRIVHSEVRDMPMSLPLEVLHKISVICAKYECTDIVRPWVFKWLANGEEDHAKFGCHLYCMCISWQFRTRVSFQNSAPVGYRDISIDDKGNAFAARGELLTGKVPSEVLENMLQARRVVIRKLLENPPHRSNQSLAAFFLIQLHEVGGEVLESVDKVARQLLDNHYARVTMASHNDHTICGLCDLRPDTSLD